jgi:glutathione S-transferase|tara:strand:- start:1434 stop:1739 length:306 start_codon:yes stop_codon:yes gene_type:complete
VRSTPQTDERSRQQIQRRDGSPWLIGATCTHVDLSLFQIIAGLRYAFRRALCAHRAHHPGVFALYDRVMERPKLSAYLASTRWISFNQHGVFRHYPELDTP